MTDSKQGVKLKPFGLLLSIDIISKEALPERIYNPISAMFTFQLDNTKR